MATWRDALSNRLRSNRAHFISNEVLLEMMSVIDCFHKPRLPALPSVREPRAFPSCDALHLPRRPHRANHGAHSPFHLQPISSALTWRVECDRQPRWIAVLSPEQLLSWVFWIWSSHFKTAVGEENKTWLKVYGTNGALLSGVGLRTNHRIQKREQLQSVKLQLLCTKKKEKK